LSGGADECYIAEALQLAAVAAVDQFIIVVHGRESKDET
jgi:hypothetical protein